MEESLLDKGFTMSRLLWVGGLCLLIRDFIRTAWLHGDDVGGANGDGVGGDSETFW